MNYLITGGTVFVGKKLVEKLHEKNYHTYILTRTPRSFEDTRQTTFIGYDVDGRDLPTMDGVINLAGESLFSYWTKEKKEKILKSRVETTNKLLQILHQLPERPRVLVSGSAVGFYGMSEEHIFTEKSCTPGNDFLAEVTAEWEKAAQKAENMNIRTVFARFGVILGNNEGAFPLMRLPVKLFTGGPIGSGEQWMSWVHIDDVVNLIMFCLFNENISGAVNVTAPNPKRNKDFMKTLATCLNRPHWLPVPSFFMRLLLGEMSQLITNGQYVLPKKALNKGFHFTYPNLKEALNHLT